MEREITNHYEQNCDYWKQRFLEMDHDKLQQMLPELKDEGEYFTLYHFGTKYGVRKETGDIISMEHPEEFLTSTLRLNLYTLFGYVKPTAVFQDNWVPFEKLKNMGPFGPAYQKRILLPFAVAFDGHMDKLEQAFLQLGGRKLRYSDMGYQLNAFDCIPVQFLFWDGDDEFTAQSNLLFDSSATDFIHGESIVTIASVGIEKLARLAGLSLPQGAL